MRRNRKTLNFILSLLLIVGMLVTSMPLDSYAAEITDDSMLTLTDEETIDADKEASSAGTEASEESLETEGAEESIEVTYDDEEVEISEEVTETSDTGEDVGETEDTDEDSAEAEDADEDIGDEIGENPKENAAASEDAILLSEEQIQDKEALAADVVEVEQSEAGQDYAENEVVLLCDSEEEALIYAEEYEEATGHKFTLISFESGVATLEISEEEFPNEESKEFPSEELYEGNDCDDESVAKQEYSEQEYSAQEYSDQDYSDLFDNLDPVEATVNIAADLDNNLPAVTPNYYYYLDSPTDNELFTDPFLKSEDSDYQYYHEVIGSKYVFDELDEIAADKEAYDGPLNKDILDNLNEIVVEVIDSGINENHVDFLKPSGTGGGAGDETVIYHPHDYNGKDGTYEDGHGHGSNVAGIIGNTVNTNGGRGIASGVKVKPAKATRYKSETGTHPVSTGALLAALNDAVTKRAAYNRGERDDEFVTDDMITSENICVINMSLGSTTYNSSLQKVINRAFEEGIVLVASAGNSGVDTLNYPASYDNVISVGSVNANGFRSTFSNYGRMVDVAAPGGDYARTVDGKSYSSQYIYASGKGSSTSYVGFHGTSQAAPMVSALAALLKANNPDLSPSEIENIIKGTARQYDARDLLGAGIINVAAALGVADKSGTVTSSVQSGRIEDGCEVHLSCDYDGRSGADYEGIIYYTTDGSVPDVAQNPESTKIYDSKSDTPITLNYDGEHRVVTLMATSVLFGEKSAVTSYEYSFDLPEMKIVSSTGKNDLSVGKSFKLIARDAETGENCKVTWESSNKSVLTVDRNGNVKAVAYSDAPVTITAKSVDLSHQDQTFVIDVNVRATGVELEPLTETYDGDDRLVGLYDRNTIILLANRDIAYDINTGKPYDPENPVTEKKWHVYPENATQEVTFKSSNEKVATVSTEGIVTPLKTGFATITIAAADGSGAKETFRVKCECGITSITVGSKSGKNYVVSGKSFTPTVIFNEGKSVPDNKTVKWKFTDDSIANGIEYYASINPSTGVVKVDKDSTIRLVGTNAAKIVAYSPTYGVSSEPYSVNIFPETIGLYVTDELTDCDTYASGVLYLNKGDTAVAFNKSSISLTEVEPLYGLANYDVLQGVSVTSSNPRAVSVLKDYKGTPGYTIMADGAGKSTITVKALDGTNKSAKFDVYVIESFEFECTEQSKLTPGKNLTYKTYINGSSKIPKGLTIGWSVVDSENEAVGYIDLSYSKNECKVSFKNGSNPPQDATSLAIKPSLYRSYRATVEEAPITYANCREMMVLGTVTSSVGVKIDGEQVSRYEFDSIGEKVKIVPFSLPEDAVQNDYLYKTSNAKVAKVVSIGSTKYIESVGNGTCKITITAGDNSKKSCTLNVNVAQKVTSVTLTSKDGSGSLMVGKKLTLVANINKNPGEKAPVTSKAKISFSIPNEEDRKFAKVSSKGVVTALAANDALGNPAKVTVTIKATAGDESDEFELVIFPKVKSLATSAELKSVKLRTSLSEGMSDPAGCPYKESLMLTADDFAVYAANGSYLTLKDALEQGMVDSWSAKSMNSKIVTCEYVPGTETTPAGWMICPVKKGSAKVRVYLEGSQKYVDVKVSVTAPMTDLSIRAKSGAISSDGLSAKMKPSGKLKFAASYKAGTSNTKVRYEYVGTSEEVEEMKKYATLSSSGTITAKKASIIGSQPRTIKVRAKAADIWGAVSNVYSVTVNPGVVYISDLVVWPETVEFALAAGAKVQMKASCNTDATDRRISWHIYDSGNLDDNEGSDYAVISQNGVVKAASGITETHVVEVSAWALAGSGEPVKSERISLTIYPSAKSFGVVSDPTPGITSVNAGEYLSMHVDTLSSIAGTEPLCNYRITYTTGAAKVYLEKNPGTGEYDGTHFSIYGLSRGTVTITVTAIDGSGKSIKLKVKVI